jgi:hypothetical protein
VRPTPESQAAVARILDLLGHNDRVCGGSGSLVSTVACEPTRNRSGDVSLAPNVSAAPGVPSIAAA